MLPLLRRGAQSESMYDGGGLFDMLQPWTSDIAAWKGISATSGNTTTSSRRSSDDIDCDSGSNSGDGPFSGRSNSCVIRSRLRGDGILMTPRKRRDDDDSEKKRRKWKKRITRSLITRDY